MLRLLFPRRLIQWLGPLFAALAVVLVSATAIIVTGIVDLSAAKPHPDGWARFLHFTFHRSTEYHAGPKPPADLDSPIRVAAGAAYYGQVCARCHSGPGFRQNPVVLSMHPRPQYLAAALPIEKYTAPELFRIVKAGVKYSAMPSWPVQSRNDEVWQLVAFLRAMPGMSPETFRTLALPQNQAAHSDAKFGAPPRARTYALQNDQEPPVAEYGYKTPVFGLSGYALDADPTATCAQCHGSDGAGGGAFPNLTLQTRDYLERSLTAFASGKRSSGFMQVFASELSPAQIRSLANHFASMPRRSSEHPAGPVPVAGQQLALVGMPKAGLAPCAACHGITRAAEKAYPLLEGQASWYIANQMRLFAKGGRGGIDGQRPRDPMVEIAQKLTDRQIAAVASYYAAQPPATVQSFAATKPLQ